MISVVQDGGLHPGEFVEITGPSNSGKTQVEAGCAGQCDCDLCVRRFA